MSNQIERSETSGPASLTRRTLLGAGIAGGLILSGGAAAARKLAPVSPVRLNAWLSIAPDDTVTIIVSQSEMGQGISTTLPMLLADELGADWPRVKFEWADYDPAYEFAQYHWMFTGNSESIIAFHDLMRTMGAAAREMLVSAAARRWKLDASQLTVRDGKIYGDKGRSLTFGAVAADAAKLPAPKTPRLKSDSELTLIGKPQPRVDIPAKTDGSAVFGIDVKLPGMLVAAIRRCPVPGGKLVHYPAELRSKPGVVAVVEIPSGLAVVAKRWWMAKRVLDEAELVWDEGALAAYSTASNETRMAELMEQGPFDSKKAVGDAGGALAAAADQAISAVYEIPAQAHATMEPMNCTAHVTHDSCDIWAPTQGVEIAHFVAKQITGLPDANIRVHRTLLGGGFGRRLLADFVKIAVLVARNVDAPVKVLWSREEDFHYDAYRPAMRHRVEGVLDQAGMPLAMAHRVVSPSHLLYVWPRPGMKIDNDWTVPANPPAAYDTMSVEGIVTPPYAIPNYSVQLHRMQTDLTVSVWRTTGHGPNNFVLESFIDELASHAGKDPMAYRRALASREPRVLTLLDMLADKAGWGRAPAGVTQGMAVASAFGGYIAQVVELSVDKKEIKLHRIVSVVDCGRVLDSGIASSNIAGGIVWGLSGLRTEATFLAGRIDQSNFDNFDPVHLWETPPIEVYFIDGDREKLGGTGEIGPVPTHAAICNAIFKATGERIRKLPLAHAGYSFV
jgi:isoquinoline 1-oxidoreductase subunit beta